MPFKLEIQMTIKVRKHLIEEEKNEETISIDERNCRVLSGKESKYFNWVKYI